MVKRSPPEYPSGPVRAWIKTDHKSNLLKETINNHVFITLYGVGTTNYNTQSSVIKFIKKKLNHYWDSDINVYKDRDFEIKFFKENDFI